LFQDNISIRAITADANKIWYAANNSRFGFTIWKSKKFESKITKDSLPLEFRSIAQTATSFLLSVANPALLYQVSKKKPRLTYQENNKKVFMTA
jgi:hypothetical protein